MKLALLFAALIACGAVDAQTYVGGSVGYGSNSHPTDKGTVPFFERQMDTKSANGSLFVGHRRGWWGVEAGAFTLPRFEGKGYTWDYPAYSMAWKGHPPVPGDNTKTAQITGQARGTALYARANVYGPELRGFTPYLFGGVATSLNRGYQFGFYNGTDFVEHEEKFRTTAAIAGVGVQYQMCDRWAARVEYTAAPKLYDNPHFGTRDVDMLSVGLVYQWGAK